MGVVERVSLVVEGKLYEFQWDDRGCAGCALRKPKGPCDGSTRKQEDISQFCCGIRGHIPEGKAGGWLWKRLG